MRSRVYLRLASYAPAARPVVAQAIPILEGSKIAFVPVPKSLAFSSLFESVTNTSFRVISALYLRIFVIFEMIYVLLNHSN